MDETITLALRAYGKDVQIEFSAGANIHTFMEAVRDLAFAATYLPVTVQRGFEAAAEEMASINSATVIGMRPGAPDIRDYEGN